ncbi:hypothetical protein [Enterococcus faecium]|uniref:hypothetical protein n=1 Tax=Enterococcus faecium TaxID=1352 RepID=UPI002153352B|nr:hypothetical protein [Enterococcus faecium]
MSTFKEKVLSEISFAMVDDAPDLQKLYDKVAAIDEHPELNDNQKIVLEWLKLTAPTGKPIQVVFWMMNNAAWGHLDELRDPLMELTDKQQFEVLAAFAQWGLEQVKTKMILKKQIQMYLEELEELDNRDEDEYFEQ